MSKIICDVCGTSYPDTAAQCPICGCVRAADAQPVVLGETEDETRDNGTYTYVKGGRFSKANVRKRNSAKPAAPVVTPEEASSDKPANKGKTGKGLVITIIILLLAILAVLTYIAVRFVVPIFFDNNGAEADQKDPPASDMGDQTVACTGLSLSDYSIEFTVMNDVYTLIATPDPVDTTDTIRFESADETVAEVDADGTVSSIGIGETVITVYCGDQIAECTVTCNFVIEGLELTAGTYTFTQKGETWNCYAGALDPSTITWTSSDELVATVENGVIKAVGAGFATIYAELDGQEVTCDVECADSVGSVDVSDDSTEPTTAPTTVPTTAPISSTANPKYKFNVAAGNDVTFKVGDKHSLRLLDENKKALTGVKFTSKNQSICTITAEGTLSAVGSGYTTVVAVHNGVSYTCKIRVVAPAPATTPTTASY